MRIDKNIVMLFLAPIIGFILGFLITISIANYRPYERNDLKRFNKINNTTYSIDEWVIYEYDIKNKYKLFEEDK